MQDEKFGWCFDFPGGDAYIDFGNPDSLQITGSQTLELWIRSEFDFDGQPIDKYFLGEFAVKGVQSIPNLSYRFGDGNQREVLFSPVLKKDEWTHVAFVRDFDRKKVFCFINGQRAEEQLDISVDSAFVTQLNVAIGRRFIGQLAHIRIYDEVRSARQIQQDMQDDLGNQLLLYLKLDEVVSEEFIDHSDYSQKTITQGDISIVDDDKFTHVAQFVGENLAILLPDIGKQLEAQSFTLETWVKIVGNASSTSLPILTMEESDPDKGLGIGLINPDAHHAEFHPFIGNPNPQSVAEESLVADQWYHLAFVYEYGSSASDTTVRQKIFIDGHLASNAAHPPFEGEGEVTIGSRYQANDLLLSNLRIYRGALSELEIQHDMYQDRPHFAFQEIYPIDFSLRDPDQHEALYLVDRGTALIYTLEIRNTSQEVISLKEMEPTAGNYHFALHFRPGVLAADSLSSENPNPIQITGNEQENWAFSSSSAATGQTQGDILYFVWRGSSKSISPGQRLEIRLANVRVNAAGGSRGTRVELLTNNLYFRSSAHENIQIHRENHLNIISHRGQKTIPLHVGFIGSNTAINNGEENNLTLRITNSLKNESIEFSADPPSQINISFDVDTSGDDHEEFALGHVDEVRGISITHPEGWEGDLGEDEIPIWTFQPQKSITLEPEQYLAFNISKIVTKYPTGQTYLKVSYQNIPGYWDGHFVVPINYQQPVIMRGDHVGIGTNHPATELEVIGNVKANEVIANSIHSFFAYDASKSKKLRASQGQENSRFGYSVAISSDWAIIGTPVDTINGQENAGSATMFYRGSNGDWQTRNKLQSSSPQKDDYFGSSVAIYGDWAIVGAPFDNTRTRWSGAVYLFRQQNNNDWVFHSKIHPSDPSERSHFGNSVAISENWFIVGTWSDDTKAINAGAAYLFHLENDGTWKENQKIQAFKNENNQQLDDQQEDANFGTSVAILGSWAVVGAPNYDSDLLPVKGSGAAYIFQLQNNDTWTGHSKIRSYFPEENDSFGGSVAISGEWVIVGEQQKKVDSIVNAGAAYLFYLDDNKIWKQYSRRIEASDKQANDNFGMSVAIAGNWALVGAPGGDPDSLSIGAAYIFHREKDTKWRQYSKQESSDPTLNDYFGNSVAIDDQNAIVGAYKNDSEKNTGAVYIFPKSSKDSIFSKSSKGSIFLNQSTGNIGINTGTPSNNLTISHPGNANQMLLEGGWEDSLTSNSRLTFNAHLCGIGAGHYTHTPGSEDALVLWTLKAASRGILFASTDWGDIQKFSEMQANMFIAGDTGNVGIGTNEPSASLTIAHPGNANQVFLEGNWDDSLDDNARINFINNDFGIGAGCILESRPLDFTFKKFGLTLWSDNKAGNGILFASTDNGSSNKFSEMQANMFIAGDTGNVGIGTNEPSAPLSIETEDGKEENPDKAMHITNDCILFGGNNNGKEINSAQISAGKHVKNSLNIIGMASGTSATDRKVYMWAEGGFGITGNVGIGTSDTSQAKLSIKGKTKYLYEDSNFHFMSKDSIDRRSGDHKNIGHYDRSWEHRWKTHWSILTDNTIAAPFFMTHSDERIKTITGKSNNEKDLEILLQIEITDYFHKDPISMGNTPQKKVIAQQVERVFPQAVSKNLTEVVPDIRKQSKATEGGMIQLENHGLQVGEKVRLIFEQEEGDTSELYEVLHVSQDDFQVKTDYTGDVFVYGRQVDDFHQVDIEAISMLNVSATQELHKRLEAQENEIKELKDLVAKQASQIEQLLELCNQGSITNELLSGAD